MRAKLPCLVDVTTPYSAFKNALYCLDFEVDFKLETVNGHVGILVKTDQENEIPRACMAYM